MKWIEYESDHYTFHYHPGSAAEKEIEDITGFQERCYQYLTRVLNICPENKINYYLCNTPEEVGVYYGDFEPCSGFTRIPNEIYVVYNRKSKAIGFHEDTHLIANQINADNNIAIKEGLAMFFEKKWCGIHNFEWVIYCLESDQYVSIQRFIKDDFFYDYPSYLTYPTVGAFTQYLISTYGIERYLRFYKLHESTINKRCKDIYDCSLKVLETEFLEYVRLFKLDYVMRMRILEILGTK